MRVDRAGEGEGERTVAGGPIRPLRVLVVDDEEPIRVAIRIVLERRGHAVREAASVEEGLIRVAEELPDVALVDLRLPGNGLNLLRQLEVMPALTGRTALMTGSEDLLMDEHGKPVWPRWIAKPFEFDALIELVERLAE